MHYKHSQLKLIKKNTQNEEKVLCSSSLAIIWRLLLCRHKTHEVTGNKPEIHTPSFSQ